MTIMLRMKIEISRKCNRDQKLKLIDEQRQTTTQKSHDNRKFEILSLRLSQKLKGFLNKKRQAHSEQVEEK